MKSDQYSIRRTQVYGMRCSGTNYLEALIQRNFPSLELGSAYENANFTFGWKHGDVNTPGYSKQDGQGYHKDFTPLNRETSKDALLIVLYRNPLSWLQSIHQHPWHAPEFYGLSFSEFLRHDWKAYYSGPGLDQSPDPAIRRSIMLEQNLLEAYDSVLAMRKDKISTFESFKKRFYNVAFINYEDLSHNPTRVLSDLAIAYNLELASEFATVNTYKGGETRFTRSAYEKISKKDLQYILDLTDWRKEERVGYVPRSTARMLTSFTMAQSHPETLLHVTPRQRFYRKGEKVGARKESFQNHLRTTFGMSTIVEYELSEWQAVGL